MRIIILHYTHFEVCTWKGFRARELRQGCWLRGVALSHPPPIQHSPPFLLSVEGEPRRRSHWGKIDRETTMLRSKVLIILPRRFFPSENAFRWGNFSQRTLPSFPLKGCIFPLNILWRGRFITVVRGRAAGWCMTGIFFPRSHFRLFNGTVVVCNSFQNDYHFVSIRI